jgi:alpha-tubulin suppressor-like RCC1 family protein
VLADGSVTCWGAGSLGRLGYGNTSDRLRPLGNVDVGGRALAVAVGAAHSCALLEGGGVRCWGSNRYGQLGYGHTESIGDDETPAEAASLPGPILNTPLGGDVPIGGGGGVLQLTTVESSSALCARFETGTIRCWGQNDHGQLGYGHTETLGTSHTPDGLRFYPTNGREVAGGDLALPLDVPARALADNGRCALLEDRSLYCWGLNDQAALGLPNEFPAASERRTPLEMGPVRWEP